MIWKFLAASGFTKFYFPIEEQKKYFETLVIEYFNENKALSEKWTPLLMLRKNPKRFSDFFEIEDSGVMAISKRALDSSRHFFDDEIELLPLSTDAGAYFIINVLKVIDCLNKNTSNFKTANSGKIIDYKYLDFHMNHLTETTFFKIPELPKTVLILDDGLSHYEGYNFNGLEYDQKTNML